MEGSCKHQDAKNEVYGNSYFIALSMIGMPSTSVTIIKEKQKTIKTLSMFDHDTSWSNIEDSHVLPIIIVKCYSWVEYL